MTLPKYLFFYGLSGSGKNYCADVIGQALGYSVHDLDEDFTPAIARAVKKKQVFTDEMRTEFFENICSRMGEIKNQTAKVIFHQAAYKERLRNLVRAAHPEVIFVWIDAQQEIIRRRLLERSSDVSLDYADSFLKNFEASPTDKRLLNDGVPDAELITRFIDLF